MKGIERAATWFVLGVVAGMTVQRARHKAEKPKDALTTIADAFPQLPDLKDIFKDVDWLARFDNR